MMTGPECKRTGELLPALCVSAAPLCVRCTDSTTSANPRIGQEPEAVRWSGTAGVAPRTSRHDNDEITPGLMWAGG